MLASMLLLFGVAAVSGILLSDDEQTVGPESEDSSEQKLMDGTDDILSSIEGGDGSDVGTEDIGSSSDVSFWFDDSSLERATEPLDDWTQSEDLLTLSGDQTVFLEFSEDLNGSLLLIDANYAETIQSGENAPIQIYVGQNVYFVPEGETFPPEYEWSIEGNSLYNSFTHVDDTTAFTGIKLIARLDGGSFLSSPTGALIQNQTYQSPTLMSNLAFS